MHRIQLFSITSVFQLISLFRFVSLSMCSRVKKKNGAHMNYKIHLLFQVVSWFLLIFQIASSIHIYVAQEEQDQGLGARIQNSQNEWTDQCVQLYTRSLNKIQKH